MQKPWHTVFRISVAIVATIATTYFCSIVADSIIGASDISDKFYLGSWHSFFVELVVSFIAFFAGGLIANSKFLIPSIVLQLLIQVLAIKYFAAWAGRSFFVQLAQYWPESVALVSCAAIAAVVGMNLSRRIYLMYRGVVT